MILERILKGKFQNWKPVLLSLGLLGAFFSSSIFLGELSTQFWLGLISLAISAIGFLLYFKTQQTQKDKNLLSLEFAEQALEQAGQRAAESEKLRFIYHTLMETAQVGMFQTDAFGNLDYVNPHWIKMTGLGIVEAIGNGWTKSIHLDDRQKVLEHWKKCAKTDQTFEMEFRLIDKVKPNTWVNTIVSKILNADQNVIGYVGIQVDVTEKKLHQNLIDREISMVAHNAKMTSLVEMSRGVAHEINNPLAIIVGKTSLIRRSLQLGLDLESCFNHLDRIEQTAFRIGKIISSLRAFSGDASKEPMIFVSIEEVISETLELCQQKLNNNNVELRFDKIDSIEISCRPAQISQILFNLISNASDAVKDQENAWISLETFHKENFLEIAVTDSGPGIKPEIAAKIMQPFFTTKEIGQGTGLGLSIAKGLAEEHGGTLTLDSNSPNTRFVIRLPIELQKTLAS